MEGSIVSLAACSFTDVSGSSTQGEGDLVHLSSSQRMLRSAKRGGIFVGIALVTLPIPGLHLVLPPIFLTFGIYTFVKTMGQRDLMSQIHGTCPSCKQTIEFKGPINAAESKEICPNCRQLLKIRAGNLS